MSIYITNTLSGKKEEFIPLKKDHVSIYNCGPTVYDSVHIGNLRSFTMYDIVRRVFEYEKYQVTQVMNITDVDDKTIARSKKENTTLENITRKYEGLFLDDIRSLHILEPHRLLRARDYIKEMIEMISILLEKGIAYPTRDGIYFSIGMSKGYGALAKIKLSAEVKERIANDEYEKENPRDFAVWKFTTEDDGEIFWEAPFGKGRPGWHIECSAMSTWALGPTIDIHTGGIDLLFPHHTNEIAQSEAATDKQFVKYWLHGGFVNVNDQKMAKSKGTSIKLRDLEDEGVSPLAFRYWLLTSHYRSPINFTFEAVKGAQTAFVRLLEAFIDFNNELAVGWHDHHTHETFGSIDYKDEFRKAITDDFNMPEALALVWKLIKDHGVNAQEKSALLLDFDQVLGFGLKEVLIMTKNEVVPVEVTALAEAREESRKNKEWEKADALRLEIEKRGYEVKDTEDGFEIKSKNSLN